MNARLLAIRSTVVVFSVILAGVLGIDMIFDHVTLPLWADIAARLVTDVCWGASMAGDLGPIWVRAAIEAESEKK